MTTEQLQQIQTLTATQRIWLDWQISKYLAEQGTENPSATQTLCAFVVLEKEGAPSKAALQHFLAERLPDYMVPAAIHFVEKIPRTPNGKVDRRTLAALARQQQAEREIMAPRSALETVLQRIWQEVLPRERIGISENFFQLGGHSLLVTALIAQIRDLFDLEVPLSSVFEAPTIEKLALWMTNRFGRQSVEETAQLILEVSEMSDDEAAEKLGDDETG